MADAKQYMIVAIIFFILGGIAGGFAGWYLCMWLGCTEEKCKEKFPCQPITEDTCKEKFPCPPCEQKECPEITEDTCKEKFPCQAITQDTCKEKFPCPAPTEDVCKATFPCADNQQQCPGPTKEICETTFPQQCPVCKEITQDACNSKFPPEQCPVVAPDQCPEGRKYKIIPNRDHGGDDLFQATQYKNNPDKLKTICDTLGDDCAGFNSNGWMKKTLGDWKAWDITNTTLYEKWGENTPQQQGYEYLQE